MRSAILERTGIGFKLLLYCSILLIMAGLGAGLTVVACILMYDIPIAEIQQWMTKTDDPVVVNALMWMNNCSQIFTFLLPGLLFVLLAGKRSVNSFLLRNPGIFLLLAPALLLFSSGLMDLLARFNEWIIPVNTGVGGTMTELENTAQEMIGAMLRGEDGKISIMSVITIALVPAFCEEFAFRGTLQPLLAKSTKNVHVAVWISAFIFALIHMQFYGIIPRMVMGAFLGYMVIWSGSLWSAIIAHMVNNSIAIILYLQSGTTEMVVDGNNSANTIMIVSSIILTAMVVIFSIRKSKWNEIKTEYLGVERSIV